jgi:hypothetical protein
MPEQFTNPKDIAEAGERIYQERYKDDYEQTHYGAFAAINVKNGNAVVAGTAEAALRQAKMAEPDGLFHLVRVGYRSAFAAGYLH